MTKQNSNPETEAQAFEVVRARAEAVPEDAVAYGVNHDEVVSTALGVLDVIDGDAWLVRKLKAMDNEVFDAKVLDDFRAFTLALSHARRHAVTEAATRTDAAIPLAVMEEATALKNRMLKLCSYYFDDDAVLSAELDDIRSGTGYLDLASDLARLEAIYKEQVGVLKRDGKLYKVDDVKDAERLVLTIRRAFNAPSSAAWAMMAHRVFTLLDTSYEELRSAAQFVYRRTPSKAALFPSLRKGGRKRRARAQKDEGTTPSGTSTTGNVGPVPS